MGNILLPHQIAVLGATGSGKTTFAYSLSKLLGIGHIELDAIYWGPNWTPSDPEKFLAQIKAALKTSGWVVEGNYRAIRNLALRKVDTVVWLNYSMLTVLGQLFFRTVRRTVRKKVLWNGNIESWKEQFFSSKSLFICAIRHTYKNRKRYWLLFQNPQYKHIKKIEFKSPEQTCNWLNRIP